HARGTKALQDGKDEEAASQFREALALYAKMVEEAATLNNSALVHFSLYQVTHDKEQFQRGADKIDRAIAMSPSDSILLSNATGLLRQTAAQDLIGSAIDLKVLKRGADLDLLSYLYTDKAGRDRQVVRMRSHPALTRAKGYYEKLLVLAPKRSDSYSGMMRI